MKLLSIIKASATVLLLGQTVTAAIEARGAGTKAKSLSERTYVPLIPFMDGVLEYATETFATQIIGAATSINQLKTLCQTMDSLDTRLAQQGYNTTYMKTAICAASKQTALASNDAIRAQVELASSKIWVVQALDSTFAANKLCNLYNVDSGNNVGMNGTFVKNELCGAGG
ncbi:MAG: hypothetical protein Q9191_007404 [Dirinaria sp. TL-2023a]